MTGTDAYSGSPAIAEQNGLDPDRSFLKRLFVSADCIYFGGNVLYNTKKLIDAVIIKKGDQIMTITKELNGTELKIALEGRLDTMTAPGLEAELNQDLANVESLTLDFSKLEYISSAGLRVLLSAHKIMSAKGGMKVTHVNEIVSEVFEVTGFADILTIE